MSGIDLAKLVVSLEAESAKFQKDLDKANKHLEGFRQRADRNTALVKKAFIGLAAAIPVAAIKSALDQASSSASEFTNLSTRLGGSIEEWSRLAYAAEKTDVGFATAAMAAQRATRRIAEAANGTGEAVDALNELNLSAEKLQDLTPAQQLKVLADSLEGVEKQSDKVRIAMKLFDSEGVKLLQTLDGGSAALERLEREADKLGVTMTESGAARLQQYELAMKEMDASSKALTQTLAVALGPSVAEITRWFAEVTPDAVSVAANAFEAFRHFALEAAADTMNLLHRLAGGSSFIAGKLGFEDLQKALDSTARMYGKQEKNLRKFQHDLALAGGETESFSVTLGKPLPLLDRLSGQNEKASSSGKKLSDAQKALNALMKEGARLTESLLTPSEAYQAELERLNRLLEVGAISWETYHRGVAKAQDTFDQASGKVDLFKQLQQVINEVDPVAPLLKQLEVLEDLENKYPQYAEIIGQAMINVHDEIDKVNEGLEEQTEKAKEMADELGLSFSSAFEDAIVNGENLSEVLKGLEQDIIRIITRRLVTEPLSNAVSSFAMDFLPNLFGGGRAMGGSVFPGRLYEVNEQGPELLSVGNRDYLMMGSQGGYVTPNNRLGGGGTVNVYVQVPHNASPEAYRLSARQGALEGSRLLQAGGGIA